MEELEHAIVVHTGTIPPNPDGFRGARVRASGLVIHSGTIGNTFSDGGIKVVQMAAEVPPRYKVAGVRVCYELSTAGTHGAFIDLVQLAQVQNPPATALILLDDATTLDAAGPTCADSTAISPAIDPQSGALLVALRVNFQNTTDRIVVRSLALRLTR